MNKVLIASFDMEVGGVERSLISMLQNFDYKRYHVDLMLYSHTGDFMSYLPKEPNLLHEIDAYRTFRMSIGQILKEGMWSIGLARMMAKLRANLGNSTENGYKQSQYMWKFALPFLPKLDEEYEIAISYLWPHYFVADKVTARTKIAWIHTDYSMVDTDVEIDVKMWEKFDYLFAVSEACKIAFIKKYPTLSNKVHVMENLSAPDMVKNLANDKVSNPMDLDSRFKIITVARLSYAKGIDLAVQALHALKKRGYHNIVWYVVGYGGDETDLITLINKYGLQDSFILLGKKTNPYPYIRAADIYVQPSRYEGKAVTVGEAQILAKPVLITNYSTARSQVKDREDGMICDLSIEGIADGVEEMYHDSVLRKRLESHCGSKDYLNHQELDKLYKLI